MGPVAAGLVARPESWVLDEVPKHGEVLLLGDELEPLAFLPPFRGGSCSLRARDRGPCGDARLRLAVGRGSLRRASASSLSRESHYAFMAD